MKNSPHRIRSECCRVQSKPRKTDSLDYICRECPPGKWVDELSPKITVFQVVPLPGSRDRGTRRVQLVEIRLVQGNEPTCDEFDDKNVPTEK